MNIKEDSQKKFQKQENSNVPLKSYNNLNPNELPNEDDYIQIKKKINPNN